MDYKVTSSATFLNLSAHTLLGVGLLACTSAVNMPLEVGDEPQSGLPIQCRIKHPAPAARSMQLIVRARPPCRTTTPVDVSVYVEEALVVAEPLDRRLVPGDDWSYFPSPAFQQHPRGTIIDVHVSSYCHTKELFGAASCLVR